MNRVSKYIHVRSGISCGPGDGRRVLLSLPRVEWLERQPDYVPWPPLKEPEPEPVPDFQPTRYDLRPHLRSHELSQRQRDAWALHLGGASNQKIAEWMGCTTNAVGKLLAQAREKQGIGLEK